jgi:hypothetical protein
VREQTMIDAFIEFGFNEIKQGLRMMLKGRNDELNLELLVLLRPVVGIDKDLPPYEMSAAIDDLPPF